MRILLTNDDGIYAPGLLAMYQALAERDEVTVVAPQSVQSGGSQAITIRHPVVWSEVHVNHCFKGTSVEGTPADCVKLACNELMPDKPELVIAGINMGLNTGVLIFYSGTVAAAIEGAMQGCPAFAVSLQLYRDMDFPRAARIARDLIDRIVAAGIAPRQIYNINIPEFRPGWPVGVRVVGQSLQPFFERFATRTDPAGRPYYWLDGQFEETFDPEETDLRYVREGYVTVTPLHYDMTDRALVDKLKDCTWPKIEQE